MNAKTKEAIRQHGENLLAIFPNATERDPIALCKKLRRLETKAHRFATDYCNGEVSPCEDSDIDRAKDAIMDKVDSLLGNNRRKQVPVFLNLDARGYALKIRDEWVRRVHKADQELGLPFTPIHTDFGGYGILAPDLNN